MWFGIAVMIALIVAGTWFMGMWTLSGLISQPIFCNDFEYIGCAEDTLQPTVVYNIRYGGTDDGIFYCTTDSTRCVIDGISSSNNLYPANVKVYAGDCWKNFLNYWECSNWVKDCTVSCEIQAGKCRPGPGNHRASPEKG